MQVLLSKRFNQRATRMCLTLFNNYVPTSVNFENPNVVNISLRIYEGDIHRAWACGYRTQELVALSGAHTLGNKGFGNPNLFDNSYFQILLQKPWKISGLQIVIPSLRQLCCYMP